MAIEDNITRPLSNSPQETAVPNLAAQPPDPTSPTYRWPGVVLSVCLVVLAISAIVYLSLPPKIDLPPTSNRFVVLIYTDAYWFHQNYMRWSVVDWALTAFATGTAVGAAIKNAYSVKQERQDTVSRIDLALMVLAVLAVLATTFDTKLHAGTLAQQYRNGDLTLQTAKMQFEKDPNDPAALGKLLEEWKKAQRALEAQASTTALGAQDLPGVGAASTLQSTKDSKTPQDQPVRTPSPVKSPRQ